MSISKEELLRRKTKKQGEIKAYKHLESILNRLIQNQFDDLHDINADLEASN